VFALDENKIIGFCNLDNSNPELLSVSNEKGLVQFEIEKRPKGYRLKGWGTKQVFSTVKRALRFGMSRNLFCFLPEDLMRLDD